jgi:hypothetical protein
MLELLQFVFSSPWVYFGTLVLLVVVGFLLGFVAKEFRLFEINRLG